MELTMKNGLTGNKYLRFRNHYSIKYIVNFKDLFCVF